MVDWAGDKGQQQCPPYIQGFSNPKSKMANHSIYDTYQQYTVAANNFLAAESGIHIETWLDGELA